MTSDYTEDLNQLVSLISAILDAFAIKHDTEIFRFEIMTKTSLPKDCKETVQTVTPKKIIKITKKIENKRRIF